MRTVSVDQPGDVADALQELGLLPPLPTLVVAGGASHMRTSALRRLRPVIDELAAVIQRVGAAVVDGGTDGGVMQLLGQARVRGRSFPLIGVVVASLVAKPGEKPLEDRAALEPNHSLVLLVPGMQWGDEVPWLARVAGVLAGDAPSLTVLVNGGDITYADAAASVTAGRQVLAIEGSGRTADALASALRGEPSEDPARVLAASGLVDAIDLREDSSLEVIERILSERS
jgi:SLOG in TRPM, prokaryote